jgi:hypothetical protein
LEAAPPKAVTHPTDSKLLYRGVEIPGRLARRHGIALRQSYTRVSTRARREVAKLIHRGRHREAERVVRRMRTWLGRLARDITRKIARTTCAASAGRRARSPRVPPPAAGCTRPAAAGGQDEGRSRRPPQLRATFQNSGIGPFRMPVMSRRNAKGMKNCPVGT